MPYRALRNVARIGAVAVFACLFAALSEGQAPVPPATPAGETLQSWLKVLSSGDRAQIEEYVRTVDKNESVDGLMRFHDQTGGFDLLSIESSEPLHLRFIVKEKDSSTTALGNLTVKAGTPPTVVTFGLRALPPGAGPVNIVLDAALRGRIIAGVEEDLTASYIDPAVAAKMNAAINTHAKAGDYNNISDPDAFASKLTEDLRAVSHDMHLHVDFNPFKQPVEEEPSPEEMARFRAQVLHDNCAFKKVEILPDNIGYVQFNAFQDPDVCGPVASAAMEFVAHSSALIIDLRTNGGGDPAMVSFIASYLFDKPTHLNDLYYRKDDSTHQYWTLPSVPGERMASIPVYVLTSHHTFSGAEEFSYDLQTQKRATIVGETTGGGAHPVHGEVVADYFMVAVPGGKPINPITHTDWEGKGVVPEVKVPAADALATAEKLAREKIQATTAPKH
jgi:hypothetical protein